MEGLSSVSINLFPGITKRPNTHTDLVTLRTAHDGPGVNILVEQLATEPALQNGKAVIES